MWLDLLWTWGMSAWKISVIEWPWRLKIYKRTLLKHTKWVKIITAFDYFNFNIDGTLSFLNRGRNQKFSQENPLFFGNIHTNWRLNALFLTYKMWEQCIFLWKTPILWECLSDNFLPFNMYDSCILNATQKTWFIAITNIQNDKHWLTERIRWKTTWKATKATRIQSNQPGSSAFVNFTAKNIVITRENPKINVLMINV